MMFSDTFVYSYFIDVFTLLVMKLNTHVTVILISSCKIAQGQSEGYLASSGIKLKKYEYKMSASLHT